MRELALHILDLVQNAVEAGATRIELSIEEDTRQKDLLEIQVKDNGRGMDTALCAKAADPFTTSRTTRKVGLGLALIDMSTRQCGGYLRIESRPGCGTTVTASYRHSHWDRPPLGNMAATLKVILVGNPDCDFSYCHTVNDRKFVFSAAAVREALNGVPLTEPEVLAWLDSYFTDHITDLYGGVPSENH